MLRARIYILLLAGFFSLLPFSSQGQQGNNISINFFGDTLSFHSCFVHTIDFTDTLSAATATAFYDHLDATDDEAMVTTLTAYRRDHKLDDWLYYQLIRKTAEAMAPKAANYYRYTLYKWYLLCKSGYNATINRVGNRILLYVQNNEDIYDLPYFTLNGVKYICMNYHDYGYCIDFAHEQQYNMSVTVPGATHPFTYKLTQLPKFRPEHYHEKELAFTYHGTDYKFKVKINSEVQYIFTNYPVADYSLYFDAPLSEETYNSLIPQLRAQLAGVSVKHGIDYLMHFTRYAFAYQPDYENFGREKHLSAEQTLLYEHSDCEDRAALFYYLIKELYNLPMIAVAYPHHLTIAVKLDKPTGEPIIYKGSVYSICEPTPQTTDLPIGRTIRGLKHESYEIAYVYQPK
jgi:hypothetical protein